jgi:hypothetical protein
MFAQSLVTYIEYLKISSAMQLTHLTEIGQNRFYTAQIKPADFEAKYAAKIKEIAQR